MVAPKREMGGLHGMQPGSAKQYWRDTIPPSLKYLRSAGHLELGFQNLEGKTQ